MHWWDLLLKAGEGTPGEKIGKQEFIRIMNSSVIALRGCAARRAASSADRRPFQRAPRNLYGSQGGRRSCRCGWVRGSRYRGHRRRATRTERRCTTSGRPRREDNRRVVSRVVFLAEARAEAIETFRWYPPRVREPAQGTRSIRISGSRSGASGPGPLLGGSGSDGRGGGLSGFGAAPHAGQRRKRRSSSARPEGGHDSSPLAITSCAKSSEVQRRLLAGTLARPAWKRKSRHPVSAKAKAIAVIGSVPWTALGICARSCTVIAPWWAIDPGGAPAPLRREGDLMATERTPAAAARDRPLSFAILDRWVENGDELRRRDPPAPVDRAMCTGSRQGYRSHHLQYAGASARRAAATASRHTALLGLRLQLGKLGRGLLHVGRGVRELLHLANLDHFVVRSGTARRPFDHLFLRLYLKRNRSPVG